MVPAVALLTVLPGGSLFGFAQVTDFELKFEETVIPLARERAGGERFQHCTLILLTDILAIIFVEFCHCSWWFSAMFAWFSGYEARQSQMAARRGEFWGCPAGPNGP